MKEVYFKVEVYWVISGWDIENETSENETWYESFKKKLYLYLDFFLWGYLKDRI